MIMTILSILMSEWMWSSRVIKSNEVQSKLFFCYAPLVTYLVVDSVQDTRPFVPCCYCLNLCGGRIPKSVLWLWITVGRTTATSQNMRPMGKRQPDFPSIPRPSELVIESSANKWKLCLPWNCLKFNPVVGKGLPKEKGTYLPTQSGSLWERAPGRAYQQICPNHQICLFCG
jgi:hypothetical protein